MPHVTLQPVAGRWALPTLLLLLLLLALALSLVHGSTVSCRPKAGAKRAAFPSRVRACGRQLVDAHGAALPTLYGFSMMVVPWSADDFQAVRALGGGVNRAVIFWDVLEPTLGHLDNSILAALDTHVQRATAAGLYTILDLHLNVGRVPSFCQAADGTLDELGCYATHGSTVTKVFAQRYGHNVAVLGFGLNEPPLNNNAIRNSNAAIPYLEKVQRNAIHWFRTAGAPQWIGFVAFGYGAQTPYFPDATQGTLNPQAASFDPHAYDSVGGNVVLDFHDYLVLMRDPKGNQILTPTGVVNGVGMRNWNGIQNPVSQGGPLVGALDAPAPKYQSTAATRSQFSTYAAPYVRASKSANIPLMVGEWGWVPSASGSPAYVADKMRVWRAAQPVIHMYWDYDVTTDMVANPWCARPGGQWRPWVLQWMKLAQAHSKAAPIHSKAAKRKSLAKHSALKKHSKKAKKL